MKKLLYLLLLITGMVNAQIVNIPDANFKAKLIALGVDTNADTEIDVNEASTITSLDVSSSNIADLTGISSFTSLTDLFCNNNLITYLDLTANTSIFYVLCSQNQIETINVSGLTNLHHLICSDNLLLSLNVSNISQLETLGINNNPNLTTLNASGINISSLGSLIDLPAITSIDLSNCVNLQDFGINLFPTVIDFALTTLNLSGCSNLRTLSCPNASLTTLNILGCVSLNSLQCGGNNLTTLDIDNLISLKELSCYDNSILNLNLTNLINLENLQCGANQLNSLNVSSLVNLKYLNFSLNPITNIDISSNVNLISLQCNTTSLTSLNISNLNLLESVLCSNSSGLNSIILNGLTSLTDLYTNGCMLNTLDLTGCPNLVLLDCSNNLLQNIDFSSTQSLNWISCSNNLFTALDISMFVANPIYFNCSENNLLETLNLKNGHEDSLGIANLPNLTFACADEDEISFILSSLPDVVVNSYCTFNPGGNYNTIAGQVQFDADNNGCDVNDLTQSNIRVNINDGTNTGASFTNNDGSYTFYTQAGNFELTPAIENPTWFNFSPVTHNVTFVDNNNNTSTNDFCLSANGVHTDVEMVIVPITPARPGFDAIYRLVYRNKGNQTDDIYVNFGFDGTRLSLISSSVIPTLINPNGIAWYPIPNLQPFQSGSIDITLRVNAPTDTPAVNIGDVLVFSSFVDVGTDENWADNAFTLNQTVVGSYDPNDITCLEGDVVPPSEIGNYLHYNIRFENTGTAPAENIVVLTEIDPNQFDVNSLQLMSASHQVDARINGNVVEFIFETINLESGGHGNVLLKMRTNNGLHQNDTVSKRADIYFDYNFPIDTGLANTTFQLLNNPNNPQDTSISIYPNPTQNTININCSSKIQSVELFDIQGRLLQTQLVDAETTTINISEKSKGVYFVKVTSDKGIKVEKLVKE